MIDGKKVGIIIQARMSSSRMPGKVLKSLGDKTVIWHVYNRCKQSQYVDEVVVATSTDQTDDELYGYCGKNGITVFRGNLENVLQRFYDCSLKYGFDQVVRVTGDCPLIDAKIIDLEIEFFNQQKVDYCSHILKREVPRGLDCEVFSFEALKQANNQADTQYYQEHVTPYIVENLHTAIVSLPQKYHADYRITVDEEKDYILMTEIYKQFYRTNSFIDVLEVIEFLKENPKLANLNKDIEQKHSI